MDEIKNFKHILFRDSKGRVTKEYIMDSNGRRVCFYYEYDENGNIIRETAETGNYRTIAVLEYDSDDRRTCVRIDKFNNNKMYAWQSERTEYDSDGRVSTIESTYAMGDGLLSDTTVYVYDSLGNLVKKEIFLNDGNKQIYTYFYDSAGKRIKKNYIYGNGESTTTDYFYDEGNEIKRVIEFSDGPKYRCESDYESGRKTKSRMYSSDGSLIVESEYFYDDNGRVIKEVRKKEDGVIIVKFANNITGKTVFAYRYNNDNRILYEHVCLFCSSILTEYEYKKAYERKKINYPDNCHESIFREYCNGRVIREKYTMSGANEIILENFFNKHGRKVKKELTFGDKKATFDRSFDKDGILRLETFRDDKGREATMHYSYNSNDDIIVEFFNNENACCSVNLNGVLIPEI